MISVRYLGNVLAVMRRIEITGKSVQRGLAVVIIQAAMYINSGVRGTK